MPNYLIRLLVILGTLAIAGIIFIQSYWTYSTFTLRDQEFNQTVNIALRQVAESISIFNESELPKENLIQQRSSNIYAVNINSAIDANVLEDYLTQEFIKNAINIDFEYAVFDCYTDDLVYGNYCKLGEDDKEFITSENLPKFNDLVYYFVVKFPSREGYLLSNMRTSVIFSLIALLACIFFMYAIWVILQQKKLSELQKDFINNMTHEFKTPISSINIAINYLKDQPLIKEDERLKQYASIIKEQNNRLNNQVEKVLSIAKLENNKLELKKQTIQLNTFLKQVLESEFAKIEKQQVKLMTEYVQSNPQINADLLHLTNLISNIIDNALKYKRADVTPTLSISTEVKNDRVKLIIKDNGIGITKDHLEKIFQKFYRVPQGDIHNVKGFGLGLFYVKNICQAHGWDIKISSEINVGSTFTIVMNQYVK